MADPDGPDSANDPVPVGTAMPAPGGAPSTRWRERWRLILVGLGAVLVGSIAAGAYGNWRLWHPADGLLVVLVGIGAILVGGMLAAVGRGAIRRGALVPLVVGVGILAGYGSGPDRPELRHAPGRAEIALEAPALERTVSGTSCATTDQGGELQLATSARLAVLPVDPSIPADVDGRAFVGFHLTVGDRWRDAPVNRSDDVDLGVNVSGVTDGSPEWSLVTSDRSTVDIDWDAERGTVRFADLVDASTGVPVEGRLGMLAGTISWVCGDAALPPGAAGFAEDACVGARYVGCVSEVLAAMAAAPGSEVAICEAAEDLFQVVPAEEALSHETCSGDGETFSGRVLRVVRLPG